LACSSGRQLSWIARAAVKEASIAFKICTAKRQRAVRRQLHHQPVRNRLHAVVFRLGLAWSIGDEISRMLSKELSDNPGKLTSTLRMSS
jgi:hypothetical protein